MKVYRAETLHDREYDEIVSILKSGGVIAFPTDTAYGLGADPFHPSAVERIFKIKGRPEHKPILLLVDSIAMAKTIIEPSETFDRVSQRFWPGPITIITQAVHTLPENVTAGTSTIGIRWPVSRFTMELLGRFKKPLTATSANRSGMPGTIAAEEVRAQLGDSIDALVDDGVLPSRGGSTLLDTTADPPVVLREGPVTFDTLAEFFQGRIRRQVA